MRDLRHTVIQKLLQNRFGTGEDNSIEREEDVLRRYVGVMPLLIDLCLAMRTDHLALIRGVSEFATVVYLISVLEGSNFSWCEQNVLHEAMSKDSLFAKTAEPEMTVVNFKNHLRNQMGEVDRWHLEVIL